MREALAPGTLMLHDPAAQCWWHFHEPVRILCTLAADSVPALLEEVQKETNGRGLYAAGFLAYEAAPGFDPAYKVRGGHDFPLAWFGLYRQPRQMAFPVVASHEPTVRRDERASSPQPSPPEEEREKRGLVHGHNARPKLEVETSNEVASIPWNLSVSRKEYDSAFRQIKNHIRAGDTYQVNYSARLQAPFSGDPWGLFAQMIEAQGAHYGAFVNLDDWTLCCASPELFFRLQGTDLVCKPMKGTARRGLWPAQDVQQALELQRSEKNRAENIMIVDMARNDLGRIAQVGSVSVASLFEVEKYPTLWQMTSTVRCRTSAKIPEIFRALFPAASITGAPKIRTMEIIAALENWPRRIYTGTIGFIAPRGQAQFNVAIRTVLVDKRRQQAEYGVGGGIVWDSEPALEFEECRIKAKVLTASSPKFALLETLLWTPAGGFFLLEAHLRRLAASADYFSRCIDVDSLRNRLAELGRRLPPGPQRIRALVGAGGDFSLEVRSLSPLPQLYRVQLAKYAINSQEVTLYHKTTHRQAYEQAVAAAPGCEDVLFWNEKQELTESAIANLVIEKDGEWLTPPVSCGLLPGVYRAFLLEANRIKEKVIRRQDLRRDCKIYLVNSVRGMWPAKLINPPCAWDDNRFGAADRANPAHAFSADQR